MAYLLKDPAASVDYEVDWGADYLGEESLIASRWEISPGETGGLAVVASRFEPGIAAAQVTGGIRGHVYRLVNHVVLDSGREDRRSIAVRVETR